MSETHFYCLKRLLKTLDKRQKVTRLVGALLTVDHREISAGEPLMTPLDSLAEGFLVPLKGVLRLTSNGTELLLGEDMVAYLPPSVVGSAIVIGSDCAYVTVGWPAHRPRPPVNKSGIWDKEEMSVFTVKDVLEEQYAGWNFFSFDGKYLTFAASYRSGPPPAPERPHSHEGEQINMAREGCFELTIGGETGVIQEGWIAIMPPRTEHTGRFITFPYHQLIFSTPPRGTEYAGFLKSIFTRESS